MNLGVVMVAEIIKNSVDRTINNRNTQSGGLLVVFVLNISQMSIDRWPSSTSCPMCVCRWWSWPPTNLSALWTTPSLWRALGAVKVRLLCTATISKAVHLHGVLGTSDFTRQTHENRIAGQLGAKTGQAGRQYLCLAIAVSDEH